MVNHLKKLFAVTFLLPLLLSLGGCPCGFDCSDDDDDKVDNGPSVLTLGFSDANIDDITRLVVEVDSITFKKSGTEDVLVDTFVIDAVEQDSFQVNLLDYQGRNQFIVIEGLELATGSYDTLLITLLDGDINYSFVEESDGSLKVLNVPAGGLALSGLQLVAGEQSVTVEFNLALSVQHQEADDSYLLAQDGIRIEDNAVAASLSGRVATELFDTVTPCDEKLDPQSGNRIYLYSGTGLSEDLLADVYTNGSSTAVPDNAIAPYAVAALVKNTLTGVWDYAFGFLSPGGYTLAFSCDAAGDDPVDFDDLTIPLPLEQIYEIDLSEAEQSICDLELEGSCS